MHKGYITLYIFWMMVLFDVSGQTNQSPAFTAEKGVESYIKSITQGLRYQIQADSMLRLIDAQNALLSTVPESEKRGIRLAILNYDIQASKFQKIADDFFQQAVVLTEKQVNNNSSDVDTGLTVLEGREAPKFAILSKSPYSATNPIPIDEPLPDGVVYKIQLGAFSKALPISTFKGLSPLSGEILQSGATKYYVGLFWLYDDAYDALRKVREYGFKDAFIIAFYNRKPISAERAKQLE